MRFGFAFTFGVALAVLAIRMVLTVVQWAQVWIPDAYHSGRLRYWGIGLVILAGFATLFWFIPGGTH